MAANAQKDQQGLNLAAEQLLKAANDRKCWACGCLWSTLKAIDNATSDDMLSSELLDAIALAKAKSLPPEIDCRGCDVCFPAVALNALAEIVEPEALEAAVCPTEEITPRKGWPPLAGNYTVLGYQRPVAVCTLNSEDLWGEIAAARPGSVAIVGTLNTENLGIERLIQNVAANPNIRFLILCGEDSRREVGHLPGQSLVALSENGLGRRPRIVGAKGKKPVLRNVDPRLVAHFRSSVEVIDMIGETSVDAILTTATALEARDPGPITPYLADRVIPIEYGRLPERMISDPHGFFVVYPDHGRGVISLEHFNTDGVLTTLIEGRTAAEVYYPAVAKKLLSRLDHACYLGGELARAEQSLRTGEKYVQDAAPEQSTNGAKCGCSNGCREENR